MKFRTNTLFKPVDIVICRVLLTFIIRFLRTSRGIGSFPKKTVVVNSEFVREVIFFCMPNEDIEGM